MKTKSLLLASLIFFSLCLEAKPVSVETAKQVALNFYFEKYNQFENFILFEDLSIEKTFTQKSNEVNAFYVFSFESGGFVMVSAETCLNPVLGYSFKNTYSIENQPANVQYWFQCYSDMVLYARENKVEPETSVVQKWERYTSPGFNTQKFTRRDEGVGPLLTTTWDQCWPYNYYCPMVPSGGSGGRAWAGCVATAIGQIFYYVRWPESGQGYTSYIPTKHPEYGVQFADFGNTFYRFDEMVDNPSTVNTAIAEYLYHIAVSLQMNFGPNGSSPDTAIGLPGEDSTTYFFKCFDSESVHRDSLSDDQWKSLLLGELDMGYPLYYSGSPADSSAGHAWVCDGYQNEEYFHFNLGWGGQSNGYYTLASIAGFDIDHSIIRGATPDTIQFEYPFYCSGADTCHGIEGSICDGSGPLHNYLNGTNATWLIDPQSEVDSVTNITLDIRCCEISSTDHLKIYDGEDNTAPLLAEVNSRSVNETITSTGNKVFVEFVCDEESAAPGFKIDYHSAIPVFCDGQNMITDPIAWFDDGSGDFYYQDNNNCTWLIQPEGCDSSLILNFDYFDTEEGVDVLKVYDLQTQALLAEYSGNYEESPPPVESASGKMLLMFITNEKNRGQGWSAYYGTTGIEEGKTITNIFIYPNPVEDKLTLTFTNSMSQHTKVSLYSLTGKVIAVYDYGRLTPGEQEIVLNSSQIPAGIFFLRLQTGNEVMTKKVVKL